MYPHASVSGSALQRSYLVSRNVNVNVHKNVTPRPPAQGGNPSIPEADTVVEKPKLVQHGQNQPSSCLKTVFVIRVHFAALASKGEAKFAPPT
jgi:hypothetical protein